MRSILLAAAIAGILGGVFLTAIQSISVLPLIADAEAFEAGGFIPYHSKGQHDHASIIDLGEQQEDAQAGGEEVAVAAAHEPEAWAPADGIERSAYTVVANILAAAGFAFMLCAVFVFVKRMSLAKGLLWGAFGFVAFYVAPTIGLPAELPGTFAADLSHRRLWWLATVFFTSAGFCVIFFDRRLLSRLGALAMMVAPQLVGAPQPAVHGGTAPQAMLDSFQFASFVTFGAFWLVLGLITAFLFKKFTTSNPAFVDA